MIAVIELSESGFTGFKDLRDFDGKIHSTGL